MDEIVARSLAKWPNVPAVYGWLSLDRRGNWLIKGEKISNRALREFISRNYEPDARGRWYFQNGPQRVYVGLAYTPLVVHYDGDQLVDQCGNRLSACECFQDDEGSVLFSVLLTAKRTVALLDDRDLARFADQAELLPVIRRAELAARFSFVPEPKPD
jgi:hypothetical protein